MSQSNDYTILDKTLDDIKKSSMEFQRLRVEDTLSFTLDDMKDGESYAIYHATDLLSCEEKVRLNVKFPEISCLVSIEPRVLLGSCAHAGFAQVAGIPKERCEIEISRQVGTNIIIGHVDFDLESKLMELKTSVWFKYENGPRERDVLQAKLYYWITGRPIELWYMTANGDVSFDIKRPLTVEEVMFLIDNRKSPMWDWECRYCYYRNSECTKSGGMKLKGKKKLPIVDLGVNDE